MTSGLQDEVS